MIMMRENRYFIGCVALIATAFLLAAGRVGAQTGPSERELKLISVLQSNAPTAEKAITCKRLAIYGTQEAVPALARLLGDKELSSWARISLEAIPGPAADSALRDAVDRLDGELLIGAINSVGVRRDAGAVDALTARLHDVNPDVASAAAVALGCIGGDRAAGILAQALRVAPAAVRSAIAQGCIRCAEKYLSDGKSSEAMKLYDIVCVADVPKQRVLEGTRGAILARGSAGVSFLVAQLESSDKGRLGIGLRTARELGGKDVTEALAAELDKLSPDRQPLLLLAIADRCDDAVLPTVLKAAESEQNRLRITAVDVLAHLGDASAVPVLLKAAVESDAELAQTAKTSLTKLAGNDIDADLLARLPQATGRTRQTLIELAGQRQIAGALPAIMSSVEDSEAGIRIAAIQAIGILGRDKQVADLVTLAKKMQDARERAEVEKALLAVAGRSGAGCVPDLMPLMQSQDGTLRMVGLHAMAIVGGPEALAAVKSGLDDKDEAVQDEAVRTLSTWPINWPEDAAAADVLLTLAKSDRKTAHQVLGFRGYMQYLRENKALDAGQKVAKVNEVLSLADRPDEKRVVISVLGGTPAVNSLELLMTLAEDPAVVEEACSAIMGLAGRNVRGVPREQRQKALEVVVEKSRNEGLRKKAQDMLR